MKKKIDYITTRSNNKLKLAKIIPTPLIYGIKGFKK